MAFIEKFRDDYERFNVSFAAGAAAPNWWTDIMLVQYLITQIYSLSWGGSSSWKASLTDEEFNNLPDPNVDFKNLKKTEEWIFTFQSDVNTQTPNLVKLDGRVDRAQGFVPSANAYYTMQALNDFFALLYYEKKQPDGYFIDGALADPWMPQLLRAQLFSAKT